MRILSKTLAAAALAAAMATPALAGDPEACKTVRFSDVGWTDITATTATAARLLKGLGYEPKIDVLSVPVTYASLKNKDIDVFLGNWMPTMESDRKPYLEDKSIEVLGPNLEGAKYTLAVPSYTFEKGLKTFADITKARRLLGYDPQTQIEDGIRRFIEWFRFDRGKMSEAITR